jgi:hypothetical protein
MAGNKTKQHAAIAILGACLAGVSSVNDGVGADFVVDEETNTVTAKLSVPSGDIYTVAVRWVEEESP